MTKHGMRFLVFLMCVMLLMTSIPSAMADTTKLTVDFRGLTASSDGQWVAVPLTGTFVVTQNGTKLGEITANAEDTVPLTLTASDPATLTPVMATMPTGYLVQESGYTVSITAGRTNAAPVLVYANAGLFTVQADGASAFALLDEAGQTVLSFETDATGVYVLPQAFTAGLYTLRQTRAVAGMLPAEDVAFELPVYRGVPEQIVALTVPSVPVPTAQETATAEPTTAPTASPEPTAEASTPVASAASTAEATIEATIEATAEPTATPTATPTAEPTPETGALVLETLGESADVDYTLLSGAANVAQGTMSSGEALRLTELAGGDYTLVLALPEGIVMTSLNGYDAIQKGQIQWQITVTVGQDSLYQVTLSKAGAASGVVSGIADGTEVTFTGTADASVVQVQGGSYSAENLCPGDYTVTIPTAVGVALSGENWTATTLGGAPAYITTITVQGGSVSAIPTLSTQREASVSGRVTRLDDASGVAGVTAALLGEDGATVASATTDADGAWVMSNLHGGTYLLQITVDDSLALSGRSDTSVIGENGQSAAFTLLDGQELTGMDAQVVQPGVIEVNAFIDANNNGECGVYERPLAGVAVKAIRVTETGETVVSTATTDENGTARLSQLPAGTYKLGVTLPAGYGFGKQGKELQATSSITALQVETQQDSATFDLAAGQTLGLGVGTTVMSAVTGQIWLDSNADGIKTEDEPAVEGVLVEMVGVKNGLTYQTNSAADGTYTIAQIKPGSYKLRVTAPDGMMFTKYSATGRENRSIITTEGKRVGAKAVELEEGDTLDKQYVGLVPDAVIEGRCFLDANYNGLYDEGEEPLSGVALEVLKQANGKTVAETTSAEDGTFTVAALRAGTYRLRAVLPNTGVTFTTTVAADIVGNHFKARAGRRENTVENIAVETGEHKKVVIGAIMPGTISGVAYLDNDFSGVMDGKETVVSGLTVNLLDEGGQVLATEKTNAKGRYTFDGLVPGTYQLTMTAKAGYAFTKAGEGSVMLNRGNGVGGTEAFTLSIGEEKLAMDCGMILPGEVSGVVFADNNDNGLMDEGEVGLAGTVVRLMSEEGEHFSATLDADGAFRFDAVMPGRYYLRYELPEDAVFSTAAAGGNTITGEYNEGAGDWFDFATGEKVAAPLCGGLVLASLDGTTFADHDGSGTMDEGEALMSGVTLTLTPSRADLYPIAAITGEDGAFAMTALHPDTYTLNVTFPDGCVMSRTDAVTLPVKAGVSGVDVTLNVGAGDGWHNQLLGGVLPSSLTGRLWLDENNDGVLDSTEQTPAGETISVIDQLTGSVFATLTTDERGVFATEGMIPGSYTLRYALNDSTIGTTTGDSTFVTDGGALVMRDVLLSEGVTRDDMRLGIVRYTTLGGLVWVDQGGEILPLPGAEVALLDASGAQLQTAVSGEDGRYQFPKLLPGGYTITVVVPEGQLVVDADDERITSGDQISIMAQSNGRTGQSSLITVLMGENQTQLNIGSVLPGKLGDLCWLDENGNGLQDGGEGGLPGVKIELLRNGEVVAETTSDQYGYYLLENLYPASCELRVTPPAEVKATTHRTDFPAIASVLEEGDGETCTASGVTVISNAHNYNADLGFVLRESGVYPAGYGQAATQDWTKVVYGE